MKAITFRKSAVIGLILLFAGAFVAPSISGITIYVDDDNTDGPWDGTLEHPYQHIQDGTNNANNGDTIFVFNGTYYENVVVDKTISLIGEDRNATIIDGGGSGDVCYVTDDWVNISNFTIRNGGHLAAEAGVRIYGSSHVKVAYSNILNNDDGIYIHSSKNCIVQNNTITNCTGDGMYLWLSDSNTITNNNVSNNGQGIRIADSPHSILRNNSITQSMQNFGVNGSSVNDYYQDIDLSNLVNGRPIYYLVEQNDTQIDSLTNAGYVALISCDNVTIECLELNCNNQQSILLVNTTNSHIKNNTLSSYNSEAVEFVFSNNNHLTNNNITSGGIRGIWLRYSQNNYLSNNVVTAKVYGIQFQYSSENEIINCTLRNNSNGLYISYSSNNNIIYHNNFVENPIQAYDECSNYWDNGYPSAGNYWDDYAGSDNYHGPNQDIPGSDGIGDTPYNIPGDSNEDRYPLMEPCDTLFFDDFSDGNDDGWQKYGSCTWTVENGEYTSSVSGSEVWCLSAAGNSSWTDYILEADVYGEEGVDKVVAFRVIDENNFYAVNVRSDWMGADEVTFSRRVDGVSTEIIVTDYPSQLNTWYHIKVEVVGDNIKVRVDDNQVIDYTDTDTPLDHGRIAVTAYSGAYGSASVRFDNVLVASVPVENQPPTAVIDEISPNPAEEGTGVTFVGHGEDTDGSIVAYNWRSSRDGHLSDQASFSSSGLSVGTHTIYFKVQDDDGAWSEEVSEILEITEPGSFEADIYAEWFGENIENAHIYVNRGSGLEFVGTTGPGGSPVYVTNLHLGDKVRATKKLYTKPAIKTEHEAVDNTMFELWVDSDIMNSGGSYSPIEINYQASSYNLVLVHPIYKYNLIVSIKWNNCANDYYAKLVTGFKKASRYLYNVTDGQAMFNKIAVYDGDDHGYRCDLRIFSSDRRPEANINGIENNGREIPPILPPGKITFGKSWCGAWPDNPTYFRTIIHELGHYAFAFYDEYLNGNGVRWRGDPNWNPGGSEHPVNYGLMQYHYTSHEMSSSNDYLRSYPPDVDRSTVTLQYWIRKMPCWDYFEQKLESYYPFVNIIKPPYGWYPDGYIYDREGPDEQWVEDSTHVLDHRSAPKLLVANSDISVSLGSRPVSGSHIYSITNNKRAFLGKSLMDGSLVWLGATIGSQLVAYKIINGRMIKLSLPVTAEADIYSLDLTEQLKRKQGMTTDAGDPGVVLDADISFSGDIINLDLSLLTDAPLLQLPFGTIFYADTTDTILFSQVDTAMYEATVDIDGSLPGFDATGYIDITVIDSSSNENSFTSYFDLLLMSDSTYNIIDQRGMNLNVPEDNFSAEQIGVSLATYSLPFASPTQTLYPVTEMFTIRFDLDNSFSQQDAGLNIYYLDAEVAGLDERTLGIYEWNTQGQDWVLLPGGFVNIEENVVSSLINETGIYTIFATTESADTIPPGTIDDLEGIMGQGQAEIDLSWTAPGDDGIVGTATNYVIRFNTVPINDANWDSSFDVTCEPSPSPGGAVESMALSMPCSNLLYYFAIKAEDEAGNISPLSNCAQAISGSSHYTFSLLSPVAGDTVSTLTPRFDWEETTDTAFCDSALYALYYGNDSLFEPESTTLIDSLSKSEYQVINPLPDSSMIYWKVKAFDTCGVEIWCNQSDGWSFYVMYNPTNTRGDANGGSTLPKSFVLSQNYPNPFNPIAEIKYALPKDCYVKLTIYNILGQKVVALVDGKQKAGYKKAIWNATDFASGIYFYRISAGDFISTRKMVLLK